MKTKHLLLLALAIALLAVALQRFAGGPDAGPSDAGVAGPAAAGTGAETGADPELARVDGPGSAGARRGLAASRLGADLALPPAEGETRAVRVAVEWPDMARPRGPLEAVAFERDVDGASMLRALTSAAEPRRGDPARALIFEELDPGTGGPRSVRDAAVALAPVVRDAASGEWSARLELPERHGRVFVHLVGAGYFTDHPVICDRDAREVVLRPVRGARLAIEVSGADASVDVAGLRFSVTRDQSAAAMLAMGQETAASFRFDGVLDPEGRTLIDPVRADVPLQITVDHDVAAPRVTLVPALTAGTEETVAVTLTTGAVIRGRVTNPEGAPLAGADVTAYTPGRAFGLDDEEVRGGVTGADGAFELKGLPEGAVIVRADATGWLQSGRDLELDLAPGEAREGVTIALSRGSRISGRVVDAAGDPVAGVEVEARFDVAHMMGPASLNATRGIRGTATTGEDGSFTVAGLGGGPFSVRCRRPARQRGAGEGAPDETARRNGIAPGTEGLVLTLASPVPVTGTLRDDLGAPVADVEVACALLVGGTMGDVRLDRRAVKSGEDGSFGLTLPAGKWELTVHGETHVTPEPAVFEVPGATALDVTCARAVTVAGRVVDPEGRAVEGAEVFHEDGGAVIIAGLMSAPGPAPSRTDGDGRFTLLGIPPGELTISARKEGFAKGSALQLAAGPGERLEDVEIRLSRGGSIEGICFDDEGRTTSNRLVTIQSMPVSSTRTVGTNADGTFRVDGLEPGPYQVIALDMDMRPSGDPDSSSVSEMLKYMKLASAEVREGEVTTVFLGAPPSDPVEVTGRVTRTGEPYSGAMVTWLPASTGMQERMKMATTDADGRYALTLDEAGDYVVTVADLPGGAAQQITVEYSASVPDDAQRFAKDIEVPGGSLSGRVIGPDGEPLGAARVTVRAEGGVRTNEMIGGSYAELQSRADGRFEVVGLRPGRYLVSAGGAMLFGEAPSAPARTTVGPLELAENARVEGIEVRLGAPGAVEVFVADAAGKPVSGATVFLRDSQGRHTELFSMISTGASGRATLSGVGPGRYTVAARTSTLATAESGPVDVAAGETTELALTAEVGTTVVAVVRGSGDDPVPSARVQLLDDQDRDVSRRIGMADMQHLYKDSEFSLAERRMGPFPPGTYTLVAVADDGREARRRFRIAPGDAERRVTLRLR